MRHGVIKEGKHFVRYRDNTYGRPHSMDLWGSNNLV